MGEFRAEYHRRDFDDDKGRAEKERIEKERAEKVVGVSRPTAPSDDMPWLSLLVFDRSGKQTAMELLPFEIVK